MEYVEKYQQRGLSFFPLRKRSKRPIFDWGAWQVRRPGTEEIKTWQDQKLLNQIAIVCGAVSGIIVLDVDSPQAFDAWAIAQKLHLPATPMVRTAKGRHIYFKHPGGKIKNSTKKIPGADLKADGGYVVAPPSVHPDGTVYEWIEFFTLDDFEFAEPPVWLRDYFEHEASTKVEISNVDLLPPEEDWISKALQGVNRGERNDTAVRLAGYYLGRGEPEPRVLEMLRSWNLRNPEPLPDKELQRTVASVARKEAKKRVREGVGQSGEKLADGLPWDEQREARIQGLGDLLGLPISDIKSTRTDNSVWEIVLGDEGSVVIDAGQLTSQAAFRTRFCQVVHLLPNKITSTKKEPSKWDSVVKEIMGLAVHLESSPDSTALGEVQDLISGYLLEYRGIEYISKNKPIPTGAPFFILHRNGKPCLYVRLNALATQAKYTGYNLNRRRISSLLPGLGHEWEEYYWCGQTVRAWNLNLEQIPREIKEYVYKKGIDGVE